MGLFPSGAVVITALRTVRAVHYKCLVKNTPWTGISELHLKQNCID